MPASTVCPVPLDTASLNHLWATLLVDELVRQGVAFFSLSPGSRSTPLALAVARHGQARYSVHFDERGSLFLALGHARATGRPAAWITTSGTAVANGMPAVVEADADAVPLVLLTADRPAELRHTGANQAIDQVGFFGDRVRWFFDLPAPTADVDPAFVLTTAAQAAFRASYPHAGPVHLNVPFREPFALSAAAPPPALPAGLEAWQASGTPYTRYEAPLASPDVSMLAARIGGTTRGLVVAGRLRTQAEGKAAQRLAAHLGWPLLPDPLSQARLGAGSGDAPVVPLYDLLLASPEFAAAHPPEAVVLVGDAPVSKRLLTFLREQPPAVLATLRPAPTRFDPFHRVTDALVGDVSAIAGALCRRLPAQLPGAAWTQTWTQASEKVEQVLAGLDGARDLSEPLTARLVTRLAPEGEALFVAASMPIRDVDAFGVSNRPPLRVAANRGASGIDGTVATALGFARGNATGATLLIGDLALLHDLNSLAMCRASPQRLVIVCINNDGGGIFSFLPVAADAPDAFEPLFGTPHGLAFAHAAALFGLDYAAPETPVDFARCYRDALAREASTLIEVRTDRAANASLHRALLEAVRAALTR